MSPPGPDPFHRLPDDVIINILSNLCIGDLFRSRLVSKSWRHLLTRPGFPVKPQMPWRIMFSDTDDKLDGFMSEIKFYTMYDDNNRTYTFKIPETVNSIPGSWRWYCSGSSCDGGGWLLMAGCNGFITEMMLWDPISGSTRRLPALSTLPFFEELLMEDESTGSTGRAQVFSVGSVECVVGVVFVFGSNNQKSLLALCTPHEQNWSVFSLGDEKKDGHQKEILFQTGKLYMVHCERVDGPIRSTIRPGEPVIRKADHTVRLSSCDVEVMTLELIYNTDNIDVGFLIGFHLLERYRLFHHLVGSSTTGELLIVSAIIDLWSYLDDPQGPVPSFIFQKTGGFEVRRLCTNNRLCYLESVKELGDQFVLLGATGSTCVAGGVEEANIIHFMNNDLGGIVYNNDQEEEVVYFAHVIGVFCLTDEMIVMHYSKRLRVRKGSFEGYFTPKLRL